MEENSSKTIVINSVILYVRLGITSICGLFTARFALQSLGIVDFGLFSVVGSVMSIIAIVNTIMLSTSNRFIAIAIGKKDSNLINKTFNVNLIVHILIAVITLSIAYPLGDWYILHYIHFDGDIQTAIKVFNISIIGSVLSFIGVPYNGLLMAKEKFFVFCSTDVLSSVLKAITSYTLLFYFDDKLIVYSVMTAILTAYPTLVFIIYCSTRFKEYVKIQLVKDRTAYRQVLSFSVWVGVGAVATISKNQGSSLMINVFFTTIMNTALGLASTVNNMLSMFAKNISKSISPQIVKNYAVGNIEKCENLVCKSSKISFLAMLGVSTPFIIAPEFIFNLWLGETPPYLVPFTYLMIIDTLIGCLNAGIPELVFATGRIKWYQIIESSLYVLSVVVAYFALKEGFIMYSLMYAYIAFSIIILIIRQILIKQLVRFNNRKIIRESFLPSFTVLLLFLPILFTKIFLSDILVLALSIPYLCILILFIGLSKEERLVVHKLLKRK